MQATYTKLRNGDWGIRIQGAARVGDEVTVTKKSGETRIETVRSVVWSGEGVTLATIAQRESSRRSGYSNRYSNHPRTGCACGSREDMIQATDCWSCKHDA